MTDTEDSPATPLAVGQLTALRNLALKQAGKAVDWINISDARALTDLGLAERNREGWNITPEGVAALAALDAET
jgi:hypothetical protein